LKRKRRNVLTINGRRVKALRRRIEEIRGGAKVKQLKSK